MLPGGSGSKGNVFEKIYLVQVNTALMMVREDTNHGYEVGGSWGLEPWIGIGRF